MSYFHDDYSLKRPGRYYFTRSRPIVTPSSAVVPWNPWSPGNQPGWIRPVVPTPSPSPSPIVPSPGPTTPPYVLPPILPVSGDFFDPYRPGIIKPVPRPKTEDQINWDRIINNLIPGIPDNTDWSIPWYNPWAPNNREDGGGSNEKLEPRKDIRIPLPPYKPWRDEL